MPPRGLQNPTPRTDSAREAVKSFYCSLCQKGYSRSNEYEAHLSSYDHSHKQRLKDMRQLTRDPMANIKARKAEARADKGGVISIKLGGEGEGGNEGGKVGGGFKKGGFKKAGFVKAFVGVDEGKGRANEEGVGGGKEDVVVKSDSAVGVLSRGGLDEGEESDTGDEGYEVYDPRYPTD